MKIFKKLFSVLDLNIQCPPAVRYQAISTLSFIVSTAKSRSYVEGFREDLIRESCNMILNCKYEKYFDIVHKIFT